jgi:hypothetical protein
MTGERGMMVAMGHGLCVCFCVCGEAIKKVGTKKRICVAQALRVLNDKMLVWSSLLRL